MEPIKTTTKLCPNCNQEGPHRVGDKPRFSRCILCGWVAFNWAEMLEHVVAKLSPPK